MKKYRDQLIGRISVFNSLPLYAMSDSDVHRLDELQLQLKEFDKIMDDMDKEIDVSKQFKERDNRILFSASRMKEESDDRLKDKLENSMNSNSWMELDGILKEIKEVSEEGYFHTFSEINNYGVEDYLKLVLGYTVYYSIFDAPENRYRISWNE